MIGVIGYVWIMRVFLLVAMVTLLLIFVNNKVNCNLLLVYYAYGGELIVLLNPIYAGVPYLEHFVNEWLVNVISYSILFSWD